MFGEADWEPPIDPFKPELPYRNGRELLVKRHIPPLPFGRGYQTSYYREWKRPFELEGCIPSQYCLRNPPLSTARHPDTSTHTLKIIDEIAVKDGRGPQVVLCQLDCMEWKYVAKIFDPLYYTWQSGDVAYMADSHYSCEAAAYQIVEKKGISGMFLPKFYGSWTFETPLVNRPDINREVRMVLIGYIAGETILSKINNKEVETFDEGKRMDILAKAMENYCRLASHGVMQNDFAGRNIMIGDDGRVTLIDLSHSYVNGLPYSVVTSFRKPERPRNPIGTLRGVPNDLYYWVPEVYRQHKAYEKWMWARWGQNEEFEPPPEWTYEEDSEEEKDGQEEGSEGEDGEEDKDGKE